MPVAISYFSPIDKKVVIGGNKTYVFRVQHNVSMAYVDEEDVEAVLAIKGKICCNHPRLLFHRTSAENIAIWKGEGR